MVGGDRRQNPIKRLLTTKYPPKSPLYHVGSSDITRSKPHSETPITQRKRRTTARRLRRARSRASSGGTASRTSALTRASAATKSAAAPTSVRNQKKGTFSHACFAGRGVVTHG